MDMKRHSHSLYNYAPRSGNPVGCMPGPGGFPNFVAPPPPPLSARCYRPNEPHNGRLNLTQSFKNLVKLQHDMVHERLSILQLLTSERDSLNNRITSLGKDYLSEEFLHTLRNEIALIQNQNDGSLTGESEGSDSLPVPDPDQTSLTSKDQGPRRSLEVVDVIFSRLIARRHDIDCQLMDATRVYSARVHGSMEGIFTREKRMEKQFMEFFCDAERQMIDYEKKVRNDIQLVSRLRAAERELTYRDQKIAQIEDNLKLVRDRCEKLMAELQQVNADHQFEKLQLYHHVEVCKANSKSLAVEELLRWCKWKRCACGRDYENDILREFELNINGSYTDTTADAFGRNLCKELGEREIGQANPWSHPIHGYQHMMPHQTLPTGSFIPSEEAATKGVVVNDLRDRYDELQLKAAVMSNYEEVRTMIMKVVCHFKLGGLRVCEEIGGKKFVSSLFYCNSEDLVPTKCGKIFATGYGDTPEEATERSVTKAFDEIQRMETMNVTDGGMEMTFVRRNPVDSKIGKFDAEPVRMTLIRSYSCDKLDAEEDHTRCLQEAFLYKNIANTAKNYMVDWKLHIRVEDTDFNGIIGQLADILITLKERHVHDFVGKLEKQN